MHRLFTCLIIAAALLLSGCNGKPAANSDAHQILTGMYKKIVIKSIEHN